MAFRGLILPVAFDELPAGWLRCDGSEVSRTTYSALFALIGTTFGAGDTSTTFNLPNLVGRAVNGAGTGSGLSTYAVGDQTGEESHVLLTAELPSHTHAVNGTSSAPNTNIITGAHLASGAAFRASSDASDMDAGTIRESGLDQPHENRQPFLTINYLIAHTDVDPEYPVGEIRLVPFAAPTNWLACDGAAVSRSTYADLFALIGTTYGAGNGTTTFNVPDLRGRIPVGVGQGPGLSSYTLAVAGGAESIVLSEAEMATHSHAISGVTDRAPSGLSSSPVGNSFSTATSGGMYRDPSSTLNQVMDADAARVTGGGGGHENRMPMLALNFIIAHAV